MSDLAWIHVATGLLVPLGVLLARRVAALHGDRARGTRSSSSDAIVLAFAAVGVACMDGALSLACACSLAWWSGRDADRAHGRVRSRAWMAAVVLVAASHAVPWHAPILFVAACAIAMAMGMAVRAFPRESGVAAAFSAGALLGSLELQHTALPAFGTASFVFACLQASRVRARLGEGGASVLGLAVAEASLRSLPLSLLSASSWNMQIERAIDHAFVAAVLLMPFGIAFLAFARGKVRRAMEESRLAPGVVFALPLSLAWLRQAMWM